MKHLMDIQKYLKYWYVFILTIGICLGAAFLYLEYAIPVYKVSSTLLIQEDKKGDGMLKGTAFSDLNMFRTSRSVDNEIEVIRSRDLVYKVLRGLKLETRYFVKKTFNKKELYGSNLPIVIDVHKLKDSAFTNKNISIQIIGSNTFILSDGTRRFKYNFNRTVHHPSFVISVKKGPAFSTVSDPISIVFNDLYLLTESYSQARLSVVPIIKDANTIILSLEDPIPQRGIDILSHLIETYNIENVNNKNIIARNTIKFIDNRLKYLTSDLTDVEQDVESYKQLKGVTDIQSDAQVNLENSGNYSAQLSNVEVQLNVIRSIESYLSRGDQANGLVPSSLSLKDQTLEDLTSKYNNLQLEKRRLLRTANPNNPLIVSINDQLSSLKFNMMENLRNIKQSLVFERNNLRDKTSLYASRVREVPTIERGLLERSREQSVKASLYHYLLQKREETELSLSATIPTSQVVDKPAYNSTPVSPKSQLIYLCSFMLGIILPAGFLYCKEYFNPKVQNSTEVELIPGARILGELSHKEKQDTVVIQKGSRTTISELFRYIRNNLNFMSYDNRNQVLLVTSSMKGEGKTFFSINLGITLSLTEKKVILLEFDLRKPDLLHNLNLKYPLGISDFLSSGKVNLDDIIHPTRTAPNLFAIGCGTIPEDPAELLLSSKLTLLFEELKKRFDYIIIDTSPVGQVADAFSLAPYADSSIYLVRYNFTNKDQLRILHDICQNQRFKNPLVVFNDAKIENRTTYGYGTYAYA